MAIKFTEDQLNAIEANGTVLVSAAAGSGKTAVLTERVVRLICDKTKNISADKLLIVTFTNLAAAELRQRISKKMTDECNNHPGDEFYLKQKLLLQNAKICSIDSFCIELVRENFSVLGIEPDFMIADNSNAQTISERCLDNCLLKFYTASDPEFDALGEIFSLDSGEASLKKAIIDIYNYCITLPQPEKWLDSAVERYSENGYKIYEKLLLSNLKNAINDLCSYISVAQREILGVDIAPILLEQYSVIKDFFTSALPLFENKEIADVKAHFTSFELPKLTIRGSKEGENVKEQIKQFNTDIKNRAEKIIDSVFERADTTKEIAISRSLVKKLTEIVKLYYHSYFSDITSKKMLTFAMCEHLALELLCTETDDGKLVSSSFADDICKKYQCVLVDEYQDNNDLQDALFFAVSDGGKNLFMVGDVKQCIYGFRNANPKNFLKYKDEYPEYKEGNEKSKIVLKSNFRSRKGVCNFVNAFCNTVMVKEVSGMDYTTEDELCPGASFPEIATPSAELHLVNNQTKLKNEIAEAEEIAEYIENLVSSGECIVRDGEALRPARYGDFAILLRSPSKRRGYYETALKLRGIPVLGETDEFLNSPEVLSLVSLLKVVNNPTDDISLIALLSSPFFGFSFDELVALKKYGVDNSYYSKVILASDSGNEKCKNFLSEISRLRKISVTKPLGRFIREVCETYPIAAIYSKSKQFDVVEKNLAKLSFLADQYDNSFGVGLDGFLNSLQKYTEDSNDSAVKSDVNSVRILSFHKSKGLQFPICIIAATGCEFNQQDLKERYIFCDNYGLSLKYALDGELKSSLARDMIIEYKKAQLIAEEIRIFYVAMTRAEDRLVVFSTAKSLEKTISKAASKLMFSNLDTGKAGVNSILNSKSYLDFLLLSVLTQKSGTSVAEYAGLSGLNTLDTSEFKVSISEYITNDDVCLNDDVTEIMPNDAELERSPEVYEALLQRFEYRYPYENECLTPSKLAVTELIHKNDNSYSFTAKPQFMSKSGLTPAQRGTAMHKFMQFADYSRASIDAAAELERLKEWEYISEEEADSIDVKLLEAFFCSSVYKRISSAIAVQREYKFMVKYPFNGVETIIQGIADCIFEEQDGLVILDFKTDNISDVSELLVRYKEQLEIYKYAIEKIFSKPVKECILYSVLKNDYIGF